MLKDKFVYLFGNRYSRMLSSDQFASLFYPTDSDISISDIQQDVQRIAFYTREKEKEECRLARLPLITDETSLDAPEYVSAEKVKSYSNIIEELLSAVIASLPKLNRTQNVLYRTRTKAAILDRSQGLYDSAIRFAVQYRVLEQIKQFHCESCISLIEQYSKEDKTEKVVRIKKIQEDLTIEYDEKIATAQTGAFHRISRFIQAVTIKPLWQRRAEKATSDQVVAVVVRGSNPNEIVLTVKRCTPSRLFTTSNEPHTIETVCAASLKTKMKLVGKK